MNNPTELPDLDKLSAEALECLHTLQYLLSEPEKQLVLAELARRAQPEGEAPQAEPLSEARIDRIARAYFSEQWAVQHAKDAIHDALTEAVAAVQVEVPEGFVLVPIKPTPKMVDATFNHVHLGSESHNARNKRVYAAMIAAAPAATLSPLCGAQPAERGALDWPHAPGRDGAQDAPPNPAIAAQQAEAPGAKLMTYDEFFAEARRLGCKLPADVCAALAAAPDYSAPGTPEAPKWHAPGMGEVHSQDHVLMIHCSREIDDPDVDYVADNDLAKRVCDLLNAAQLDGGQEGSESNG